MSRAEWVGLGVHNRRWHGVGRLGCALKLAKMMGFTVHPLEPGMCCAQRCDEHIYVDFSSVETSGSLCGVRAQVARELAEYLLERCNFVLTEEAIRAVALETVLPETELAEAFQVANGDFSIVLDEYRHHVPAEWLLSSSVTILRKVISIRRLTS